MDSTNPIYYDNLKLSVKLDHININVMYLRYESPRPQWNVGNHFHTSYELHFIAQGEGTVWIGEKSYNLKKGTFYLTGPNIYHEQKTDLINPMIRYREHPMVRRRSRVRFALRAPMKKTVMNEEFIAVFFIAVIFGTARLQSISVLWSFCI